MSLPERRNKNHTQSKPQWNRIPTNSRNMIKFWSKALFLKLLQKYIHAASWASKLPYNPSTVLWNTHGFSCRLLVTAL